MIDLPHVEHHIQQHVLRHLTTHRFARFRDMRPGQIDTNLYSYHLKLLIRLGYLEKTDQGYTLTIAGQAYVDRVNLSTAKRTLQPKVITMLVIQDGYGNVLMYQKKRQPFIDKWTVPIGKVHNTDESIARAAEREVSEKISDMAIEVSHVGDAYIRVTHEGEILISTLAHVFYGQVEELDNHHSDWERVGLRTLSDRVTAPAIQQIISRVMFRDPYFFEEYTEELVQ